jgi:hypothetical protein
MRYIKTSSAGNTTLYIVNKSKKELEYELDSIRDRFEVEQIGFVDISRNNLSLEMEGGEFCGGAVLASGLVDTSKRSQNVTSNGKSMNISLVRISDSKFYSQVEFPLSLINSIENREFAGLNGKLVNLEGISYFVTNQIIENLEKIKTLMDLNNDFNLNNIPAIGIIVVNKDSILPYVWVKSANTVFLEQACTTGSISAEICYSNGSSMWRQPSGEMIRVCVDNQIEVSSTVEILECGHYRSILF